MKCKLLLSSVASNIVYTAFRLGLVQLAVGADKEKNVQRACQMIRDAVQKGADMVVLPVRSSP